MEKSKLLQLLSIMVTHPAMESEVPKTALPGVGGVDSEQTELLGLTGNGTVGRECTNNKPDEYNSLLHVYKKNSITSGGGIVSEAFSDDRSTSSVPREGSEVTLHIDKDDDDYLEDSESLCSIFLQVFFPYLCAGLGTVCAGLVLHRVQDMEVFKKVSELMVLVPSLLGLKGNLEMTLAARLSTQANLGNMDCGREIWKMVYGNLALTQCQAVVVAFLASLVAIIVDSIHANQFDVSHATLLCASSLATASIASVVLGCITALIVIGARRCHINPDNVATPIAASLGDVTTLGLLASISHFLYAKIDGYIWLSPLLVALFVAGIPLWTWISYKNKYTRQVLFSGWVPVISAVMISSVGGIIMDKATAKYHGLAVFQPVINGVGGNLAAVQASRISTYLHQRSDLGRLPASDSRICVSPCSAFFGKSPHTKIARVLLSMAIPGHIVFAYFIRLVDSVQFSSLFLSIYLFSAILQVAILLYLAYCMIQFMWKHNIEPDNSAIPYLTALGDLLGTALLALAFIILENLKDPIAYHLPAV